MNKLFIIALILINFKAFSQNYESLQPEDKDLEVVRSFKVGGNTKLDGHFQVGRIVYANRDKFGIGTLRPEFKLHVEDADGDAVKLLGVVGRGRTGNIEISDNIWPFLGHKGVMQYYERDGGNQMFYLFTGRLSPKKGGDELVELGYIDHEHEVLNQLGFTDQIIMAAFIRLKAMDAVL